MGTRFEDGAVRIDRLEVSAYTIPTDSPESDGTLRLEAHDARPRRGHGGGQDGPGLLLRRHGDGHADPRLARRGGPGPRRDGDPRRMVGDGRRDPQPRPAGDRLDGHLGRRSALWDLKARLLDLPLVTLLGAVRDAAPVYGSGGFTSYSLEQLRDQLGGWAAQGIRRVKMKIGTHPADDPGRVRAARDAIGPDVELFVDANGAYSRKQALAQAEAFAELDVRWFEEPVSSDDLDGLRLLRDRAPAGMDIAAGEYGYDLFYFRRMLEAARWTCSRPTPPAAPGSPDSSASPRSARRSAAALGALRRRCTPTSAARCPRPPPGVLPRSRPDRAHAVRRHALAGRRGLRPDLVAARPGARIQTPGCRPLRRLSGAAGPIQPTKGKDPRRVKRPSPQRDGL